MPSRINNILFVVGGAIGVIVIVDLVKKGRNKKRKNILINNHIRNKYSVKNSEYLSQLHPKVKQSFINFISDIEKMGYSVVITSGYRNFAEQAKLKKIDHRNASPGFSSHNYGMALDFVIVKDGKSIQKNATKQDWINTGIPSMAKNKYGMRWGGDFAGYPDFVHFDYQNKYPTQKLYKMALNQFGDILTAEGNKLTV